MELNKMFTDEMPKPYRRYALGSDRDGQHSSLIGGTFVARSADIYEIRWMKDGPRHYSEHALPVALNVRQPEAGILCGLLQKQLDGE